MMGQRFRQGEDGADCQRLGMKKTWHGDPGNELVVGSSKLGRARRVAENALKMR
jgi:hypothetical protein